MQRIISLFIYLFVFLVSSWLLNKKNHNNRALFILGVLIPVILAAGRYMVGTDSVTYERMFIRVSSASFGDFINMLTHESNPLFLIVARYTYMLGGRVLTWGVLAFLTLMPVVYTCNKEYPEMYQGIALAVFFLTGFICSFNIARQYVAIAFVFLSFKYVFENKIMKFVLFVLVAFLFHTSAIVAIIVWFFWDHKNNSPIGGCKSIIVVLSSVVSVVLFRQLLEFGAKYSTVLESYYSDYSNLRYSNNRDFYVSLFITAVALLFVNYSRRIDRRTEFYLLLLIVSTLIGVTGFTNPFVKRIALFYSVPASVVISGYIPGCVKRGQKRIMGIMIVGFYMILFVVVYYVLGESNVIPYRFDMVSPIN